jgi:hypothetical protein
MLFLEHPLPVLVLSPSSLGSAIHDNTKSKQDLGGRNEFCISHSIGLHFEYIGIPSWHCI